MSEDIKAERDRYAQSLRECKGYAEEIERSVLPGDGQECARHIQRLVDDTFAGNLPATLELLKAAEQDVKHWSAEYYKQKDELATAREWAQEIERRWNNQREIIRGLRLRHGRDTAREQLDASERAVEAWKENFYKADKLYRDARAEIERLRAVADAASFLTGDALNGATLEAKHWRILWDIISAVEKWWESERGS